jgi:betaine-aldehyde dehydrogenase
VQDSVHDEFVAHLAAASKATPYGAPHEEVAFGPLNNAAQHARVLGFLDRMPAHAAVQTGGVADPRDGGFYVQPTVVTGLRQDDEMVQDEVFGPVQTVQSFASEAEALAMANGVRYGLAASVWTASHERALRVGADLDFGQVWVNCHLVQPAELPNGGYKHSGHGTT